MVQTTGPDVRLRAGQSRGETTPRTRFHSNLQRTFTPLWLRRRPVRTSVMKGRRSPGPQMHDVPTSGCKKSPPVRGRAREAVGSASLPDNKRARLRNGPGHVTKQPRRRSPLMSFLSPWRKRTFLLSVRHRRMLGYYNGFARSPLRCCARENNAGVKRKARSGDADPPGEAGPTPAESPGAQSQQAPPAANVNGSDRSASSPVLLQDHHYCRSPEAAEDGASAISALIHEFLKSFYEKYGSFIPLSKTDVLNHLVGDLNLNVSLSKPIIYAEVAKHQAAVSAAPLRSFRVVYNRHTLTLEDLSTLDDQNWLNDQVINMYGELIMESVHHKVHFFNSFFHRQLATKGYEGVRRWTRKVDLFAKSLLLIPIHLEIHWSLVTVDMDSQSIHFYDSQGIFFKHAMENILKYIMTEARERESPSFQRGWKMLVNKQIPQQKNDNDCGVFILEYCRRLALGKPLLFSQENMPRVRKRIYKELCECKLKET